MNTNNLFNALLKLKSQLTNSIIKQNTNLKTLSYGFLPDTTEDLNECYSTAMTDESKMVLTNGEICAISKDANSNNITININSKTAEEAGEITMDLSNLDEDFNVNAPLIDGFNTTVSDILHSLSQGEVINEVIVNVNNLFLSKPTYSIGEVLNVINSSYVVNNSDVEQLKQMLINSSVNGELSNYAWAELMSKIMEDSKDTIDEEESFSVTSEHFFAMQTFFATVLDIISFVFSAVLTVVGAIFGGLYMVLAFIFQNVVNIFNTTFDTNYKVNTNATYPGVTGTFRSSAIPQTIYIGNDKQTNNLMRIPHGCEDIYFFTQKDEEGNYKTYCQSQLMLYYHPDRVLKYIKFRVLTGISSWSSDPSIYTFQSRTAMRPWDFEPDPFESDDYDPRLRADEYLQLSVDPVFLKRTVVANIMMLYLQRRVGISDKRTIDLAVDNQGYFELFSSTITSGYDDHVFPDNPNAFILILLGSALAYYDGDLTKWHTALDGIPQSNVNGWISYFVGLSNDDSEPFRMVDGQLLQQYAGSILQLCPVQASYTTIDGICSITTSDTKHIITYNDDVIDICDVDFIPNEDLVNLPSYSNEQVLGALILIAATITIATIGAKKLGNYIRVKKQVRATKRITRLNNLRDAYIADPSNITNRKAYEKALRSYNAKASLFGWGQYDSANGWLNEPSSSGFSSTNTEVFGTVFSNSEAIEDIRKLIV